MSTIRLRIADAMASAISTATGLTPYRNLDYALEDKNLPAVALQSGDEGDSSGIGGVATTDAMVSIHILVAGSGDPELAADSLEAQIHAALFADLRFGGLARELRRVSGGWNFDLGDCCQRTINYQFFYNTRIDNLEAAS